MKSWAKNVWNDLFGASPRSAAPTRPNRVRLIAEALEDRAVPALPPVPLPVTTALDLPLGHSGNSVTLRDAIAAANARPGLDTIRFAPSLVGKPIMLTQGEIKITDSLNVLGFGAAYLKIDGGANEAREGGSRIFNISGGEGIKVAMSGLTLRNGGGVTNGGAIFMGPFSFGIPSSLTLRNMNFVNNTAGGSGGALFVNGGENDTMIQNCTFTGNVAGGEGGGALASASSGKTLIQQSRFVDNHAFAGGAVFVQNSDSDLTVQDCVFTSNFAGGEGSGGIGGGVGGAIASVSGGKALIQRSRFVDNHANAGGAAFFANSSSIAILRSVFSGNGAEDFFGGPLQVGGALTVFQATSLLISYSTFTGNSALLGGAVSILDVETARIEYSTIARNQGDESGGGIFWTDSFFSSSSGPHKLTIFASTINNNESRGDEESIGEGGGISFFADDDESEFLLVNSTIYGNTSGGDGGGILIEGGTSTLVNDTITKNISQGGNGGGVFACECSVVNIQNSIVADNFKLVEQEGNKSGMVRNDVGSNEDFGQESRGGSAEWNVQYSLIQSVPLGFTFNTNVNNILGVSANLGVLRNNGGPTQTVAFLGLSPAVQTGNVALAKDQGLMWDQRGLGFFRFFAGGIDMGAFQSQLRRRW